MSISESEGTQVVEGAGNRIPPGHVSVDAVARNSGANPEVLKRKCRAGEIPGARKIPWRGRGLWVIPEGIRMPPDRRRSLSKKKAREVARRAHAGGNKAALAREFGINRWTVYELMDRYPSRLFLTSKQSAQESS